MDQPLKGIRVLDFTHLLPGELLSALLSDLGAEIVRIEAPSRGLAHRLPPVVEGESLYYWALNKRKKRLVINLKDERGKEIAFRLAGSFDVVIENFRPGVMDRLGLGYESLAALNPAIVYCSISGYGRSSKEALKPAHDLNLVAEAGVLDLNRRQGERPVIPAIPISDYMSGLLAALSVVSALYKRRESGRGEHLDIGMLDSALSCLNILASMAMYTGLEPEEGDFIYPREMPDYNVYRTGDGRFLAVASLEDPFWRIFCEKIGRLDLLDARKKGRDRELIEDIASVIESKTLAQWEAIFEGAECCVSPVNTLAEALERFPLAERGMLDELFHPTLGNIKQVVFPVDRKLRNASKDPHIVNGYNDVQSLLENAGYTPAEIDTLVQGKVVSHQQCD